MGGLSSFDAEVVWTFFLAGGFGKIPLMMDKNPESKTVGSFPWDDPVAVIALDPEAWFPAEVSPMDDCDSKLTFRAKYLSDIRIGDPEI